MLMYVERIDWFMLMVANPPTASAAPLHQACLRCRHADTRRRGISVYLRALLISERISSRLSCVRRDGRPKQRATGAQMA